MTVIDKNLIKYFSMDLAWIIGITFIVSLYLINWYKRPNKFPPGPRGIPIFGYLPFIGNKTHETVVKLSKKYGPILSIRFGLEDHLFLNDFESITKVSINLYCKYKKI